MAQNFLLVGPYEEHIVFFGHNGLYLWHLSFGALVSLTFLTTETTPAICVLSTGRASLRGNPTE